MNAKAIREALFISHANPSDNAFARWLGAKLAAMGFEVWADVMRLHGGADWARELEGALRQRALKLLVICTPEAMDGQGVRNEIEIGAQLAKELQDHEFTIPLRLREYSPHFRIAQAQYIDFSKSWATGLGELVDLLVHVHKIPHAVRRPMADWLLSQSEGATRLVQQRERLTSNWLVFRELPAKLHYCEPPTGFPLERFQQRSMHQWPIVPWGGGVLTFAQPDRRGLLGPDLPARRKDSAPLHRLLNKGWQDLEIPYYEVRRLFSDLGNQAFEAFLNRRGLLTFEGANGRRSWWGNVRTVPLTKIKFNWPKQTGSRQIIGQSKKRGVHWHYAISGQIRSVPVRHLRIYSRLIFSENGLDAIPNTRRMHVLRRSFAKWRNPRWRDMLSAFLWWLGQGKSQIELAVGDRDRLVLALPPTNFSCPVSVLHVGEEMPDEDDPDIEIEDWEELGDESEQATERADGNE